MEERVTILLKVDEAKKAAKTVIDSKKNFELLQMIKDSCRDADVINYIDSQIANRRWNSIFERKMWKEKKEVYVFFKFVSEDQLTYQNWKRISLF